MGVCLALLKAFDPNNPDPQQTVAAGAARAETALGAAVATLNEGQWAAMVDNAVWKGAAFAAQPVVGWITGGNFAKPVEWLPGLGSRGSAERDIWNLGAGI